jgi:hypothetical protein
MRRSGRAAPTATTTKATAGRRAAGRTARRPRSRCPRSDEARALGVQFRVNFRADGGSIDDVTIPDAVPVEEQKRLRKVIEANKRELVSFAGPSGIPCRGDPRYRDPDWLASAAAELGVSVEEVKRRLDFLEKKQIEWSMADAEWESFMDCWAEVEAEAKAFGLDFETYVPLAAKEGKA